MEQIFFLITTGAKHHLQKKKLDRKTEFVSTDTIAFRCILSLLCFSKYVRSFFCTVYFDRKIWLFSSIRCFSWISNLPLKICIPCTSPTQNWTTCWLFINLLHENTFCLFSYQIPMNKFIIELKIGQPKRTFLWYWYIRDILQCEMFKMAQQNCHKEIFARFHRLNGRLVFVYFTFQNKTLSNNDCEHWTLSFFFGFLWSLWT